MTDYATIAKAIAAIIITGGLFFIGWTILKSSLVSALKHGKYAVPFAVSIVFAVRIGGLLDGSHVFYSIISLCLIASIVWTHGDIAHHSSFFYVSNNDGDSAKFTSNHDSVEQQYRLKGFDSPETEQKHGKMCGDALRGLLSNSTITMVNEGDGSSHERPIRRVYANGIDVCEWMLTNGFAHLNSKYPTREKDRKAWDYALTHNKGIWANGEIPLHPEIFRDRKKKKKLRESDLAEDKKHLARQGGNEYQAIVPDASISDDISE